MSLFIVYPAIEKAIRSDSRNVYVVSAATAALARNSAEALAGANLNSFVSTEWNSVQLMDSAAQDCIVPFAKYPVGKRDGAWPDKLLNGHSLAI